jgi:hypothetical protein
VEVQTRGEEVRQCGSASGTSRLDGSTAEAHGAAILLRYQVYLPAKRDDAASPKDRRCPMKPLAAPATAHKGRKTRTGFRCRAMYLVETRHYLVETEHYLI